MKKKGTILICLSLATVFAISAAGTTLAVWRKVNTSDHVAQMATVTGQIVEQYEGAEGIYPGSTIEKVVNVRNTGTADSVIRVKVERRGAPSVTRTATCWWMSRFPPATSSLTSTPNTGSTTMRTAIFTTKAF